MASRFKKVALQLSAGSHEQASAKNADTQHRKSVVMFNAVMGQLTVKANDSEQENNEEAYDSVASLPNHSSSGVSGHNKNRRSVSDFSVAEYGTIMTNMQTTIAMLRAEIVSLKQKATQAEAEADRCVSEATEAMKLAKMAASVTTEAISKVLAFQNAPKTTSLPVSVSTVAALENLKKSTTAFTSDKSVPMVEVKPLEKEPTADELECLAIEEERAALPHLEGVIKKKSSTMLMGWQNNKEPIVMENGKVKGDVESIPLATCSPVAHIKQYSDGDSMLKFALYVVDPSAAATDRPREIKFKCATEEERDLWVQKLQKHCTLLSRIRLHNL